MLSVPSMLTRDMGASVAGMIVRFIVCGAVKWSEPLLSRNVTFPEVVLTKAICEFQVVSFLSMNRPEEVRAGSLVVSESFFNFNATTTPTTMPAITSITIPVVRGENIRRRSPQHFRLGVRVFWLPSTSNF